MQASPAHTTSDDTATLIAASRRYQIASADLQIGMFVAELDRPWLDTPFLLQGFLADSQVEIDTLRKYCAYVYVDLEMSLPEVAEVIRRSEVRADAPQRKTAPASGARPGAAPPQADPPSGPPAVSRPGEEDGPDSRGKPRKPTDKTPPKTAQERRAAGSGRSYRTRQDVRISAETRQRFRELVRTTEGGGPTRSQTGLVGRALAWLSAVMRPGSKGAAPAATAREQASREAVKEWLPPEVELTEYPVTQSIEQELPRARGSFSRSEDVLREVAADVKVGKIPQVAEVASAVDDMVASMVDNPDALLWVGRLREEDVNTYNHGVKVALYLIALGRQLGFPKKELSALGMIGMLADVGKIKLPRALLEKPGMLTPAEFGLVKEHVKLGLDALREAGGLPAEVEQGIAQHHERIDGSGYPQGLKANQISIYGRMAAIADSFAAMITPRAYANAVAPQDALMKLYEGAGGSFHEPLVEQFVQAVGVFPVGSLVELSSGEIAIVVAHNRVRRLEPKVLVLTWPDKKPLGTPIERDLLTQSKGDGNRVRIVKGLAAGAYGLKLRDYYMGEIAQANGLPA